MARLEMAGRNVFGKSTPDIAHVEKLNGSKNSRLYLVLRTTACSRPGWPMTANVTPRILIRASEKSAR